MKSETLITVFTSTYNRAYTLTQLYNSLLNQDYKDFEWLIVDDGSTDKTEELIQSFLNEKKISIQYYRKQNGGKHTAINFGTDVAKGLFFFNVDSDDYLTNFALKSIDMQTKKIKNKKNFAGLSGVRVFSNMQTIGKEMPDKIIETDLLTFRYRLGIRGDRAEVFYTHILKKYKFPVFANTKFCPEGVVFNKIANDGFLLHFFDSPLIVCEYLSDGLSYNHYKRNKNNIKSIMLCYEDLFSYRLNLLSKIKTGINYWRYSFFSERTFSKNIKAMYYWGVVLYPIGLLFMIYSELKNK